MNSLTLGFFYTCGFAWALAECCVQAAAGNPLPILLFTVAFTVIFAIMGCLDVSEKVVNFTGIVTASVLGLTLFAFSFSSVMNSGSVLVGAIKVFFALAFVVGSFAAILAADDSDEAEEAAEH